MSAMLVADERVGLRPVFVRVKSVFEGI